MNLLDYKISEKIWKISSECVEDDYYQLDNLISSDENKRRIGFMCFSVSKPPVTVTLQCKLKVDVDYIKFHTILNSLKSTKFQIMIEFKEDEKIKTRTIADISLDIEHAGFCIKNSQNSDPCDESLKTVIVENYLQKYLKNLDKIIVVIKDTQMKRAPVLKKIEIFGRFSESNDKVEVEEIFRLITSVHENNPKISKAEQNKFDAEDSFQIPEEFLDAITLELLNLPYILPSGSIVDETTLERHKRNEESHGRYPSDPFTGLLYTADSQPKFDAALKVRLDEFKLRHSHEIEIKNSGRCVGRKEKLCEPSTSAQFNSHISKKIKLNNKESSSLDDIIQSIYRNNQISSFINPQKQQSQVNVACLKCNLKDERILYKISTCSHVFCKKCIFQSSSTCSTCSQTFENEHVVKLNL